jgi:hypothetical protein
LAEGLGARNIPDIPVTTIDRIVEELDLPRVDIIKADIESRHTHDSRRHGDAQEISSTHGVLD